VISDPCCQPHEVLVRGWRVGEVDLVVEGSSDDLLDGCPFLLGLLAHNDIIPRRQPGIRHLPVRGRPCQVGFVLLVSPGFFSAAVVRAGPEPESRWSARSEARTYDLDAGEDRGRLHRGEKERDWGPWLGHHGLRGLVVAAAAGCGCGRS